MRNRLLLALLAIILLAACEKTFLSSDPDPTPVKTFEVFWSDMDRFYSYFELKNVNWDFVYEQYRPKVNNEIGEDSLRRVLGQMIQLLKDGHVSLYADTRVETFSKWKEGVPENFNWNVVRRYLSDVRVTNGILYARLTSSTGYIYIETFSGGGFQAFHEVMEVMGSYDALIIDIRNNGGGSDRNSREVAQYFTRKQRLFRYHRYRNGPAHDDFTPWEKAVLKPAEALHYTKPVAVLTNRSVFSAAEDFCLAMQVTPHATLVGDTTGGGAGNPVYRELPNGWTFRLSRWQSVNRDFVHYEGRGIYPDIPVWISSEDNIRRRDSILETAYYHLQDRIGNE